MEKVIPSHVSSLFLGEKNHGHTLVSRLSLIFILCYACSWTEMKVEGEQGRGSVKVPFITATRALPPRLLAAVLGIVMMSAAAPLWRWECSRGGHACPDIYQWQRFRDESSFRRYKRIYVKNGVSCKNMLVFIYIVTLWAFLVCHFLGLVNGGNRIACLIRIDCTDTR